MYLVSLKKLLSYIWPYTKRYSSKYNGELEVTWINGKKVLDSTNANYSYGSLEKILNFGLSKVPVSKRANILLLGLGGGCVIKSLQQSLGHQGKITAIEIDPAIISIAESEFELSAISNLEIICNDAFDFVANCSSFFDLIIIDLLMDLTVPDPGYSPEFWKKISELLTPKGAFLFNAGIDLPNNDALYNIQKNLQHTIAFELHKNVAATNTVLTGYRI